MKPIRIVLAPTRSRPVNIFWDGDPARLVAPFPRAGHVSLGRPFDEYGRRDGYASQLDRPVRRLLERPAVAGAGDHCVSASLWLGGVGWTWMRSRPGGSPILRWMGTLLALTFLPTIFGLLPWHWRWLHVVPIEGVVGRLMSGVLVVYLNIQGAWVVAAALAAAGLYFASDISFGVIRESIAERWARFQEWRDRRRDLRRDLREEEEELEARSSALHSEGNGAIPFSQFDAAATRRCSRRSRAEDESFSRLLHAQTRAQTRSHRRYSAYQRADRRRSRKSPRSPSVRSPQVPWLCHSGRASGRAANQ